MSTVGSRLAAVAGPALVSVVLIGCKPAYLPQNYAGGTFPLSETLSADPSQGRLLCVTFNSNTAKPVPGYCPEVLSSIGMEYELQAKNERQLHEFAVFVFEAGTTELPGAPGGSGGFKFANESIVYGSYQMVPNHSSPGTAEGSSEPAPADESSPLTPGSDLIDSDLETLRQICGVDQSTFHAVVQKIDLGCSRNQVEAEGSGKGVGWSFKTLAKFGKSIGEGTFLSDHPEREDVDAACTADKVPIRLHVISRASFCATFVTPVMLSNLFERSARYADELATLRTRFDAIVERASAQEDVITSLEEHIATLRSAGRASAAMIAQLEGRVNELKTARDEQLTELNATQSALGQKVDELNSVKTELQTVLREQERANQVGESSLPAALR